MNTAQRFTWWVTLFVWTIGCAGSPGPDVPTAAWKKLAAKADGADWANADPVRIALAQVRSDLPSTDYWSLLTDAQIQMENLTDKGISGFVRRGLLLSMEKKAHGLDAGHVRAWRYHLGADVAPITLTEQSLVGRIAFSMRAGSTVEFAQVFSSSAAAAAAPSPTLMQIPHDAESALALPTGMVVSVPIDGRMCVDVNGRFLTQIATTSKEFHNHLTSSAVGTTSGLRQGTLLIEGSLMMQTIRLGDNRVRLRVVTGSTFAADATVDLSAYGMTQFRFFPSAPIDRARAIKTRLERARQRVEALRSARERIELLKTKLADGVELLLDAHGVSESDTEDQKIRDLASFTTDTAFQLADSASSLLELGDAALGLVEQKLQDVIGFWDKRVEPVTSRIRRLSSRVFRMNASISLSGAMSRRVRTVADYEFDLADPDARHAFERAISGRSVWMTTSVAAMMPSEPLADLTLADALASADVTAPHRRVIRHAAALSDLRKRHFGVKVAGLWMSTGMDWEHMQNEVTLIDESGFETTWEARAWQFDHKTSWIGDHTAESFASGAFIESGQDDLVGGGYWFSWQKTYAKSTWQPVSVAVGTFLNLLGPIAVKAGIPALYDGEHEGQVTASLDVIFSGGAIDRLFDPMQTSDEVLWDVFGEVAERYDNQFGLPMMMSPFWPKVLDSIPGGHAACEKVAKTFGGWYCGYFAKTFVPALREAQASNDPTARLDFLQKFYEKGWFGNPVGSRLLVRYVATLLNRQGVSDGITVRAVIKNDADASESASPSLEFGDPAALALIETMGPEGLQ